MNYEIFILSFLAPTVPLINTTVTGTSFTSPIALDIARHRVWVRANLASGISTPWSLPRTFDVRTPPTVQPIVRFQDNYRPTISWTPPVPNVASYQIQIDSRFTAPFGLVMESGITTTSYTLKTDLPLGLYRVWVRAFTTNGTVSAWSNPGEFFIAVAPTGIAPPPSTFDTTPTFRWTTVQGGREYRIRVFDTTTRQIVIDQGGLKNPEFTPTVPLRPGIHRWNVQASGDNAVVGLWSVGYQLFVGGRTTITSPAGLQSSSTPTIRWDAVEGAFTYSIYIVRTDGTLITADNLTTNAFTPSSALAAGTYRVWVKAVSVSGQDGPWSLPVEITIANADERIEPTDRIGVELSEVLETSMNAMLVSLPTRDTRSKSTQTRWPEASERPIDAGRYQPVVVPVRVEGAVRGKDEVERGFETDVIEQLGSAGSMSLEPSALLSLDEVLTNWDRLAW